MLNVFHRRLVKLSKLNIANIDRLRGVISRVVFSTSVGAAVLFGSYSPAFSDESVKLGVLNDLTGPFADLGGKGSIVATELAIEDFGPTVIGLPISIVSADTQNKPDVATAIARQWFDVEGVDVIVDPVPSNVALAIQELIKEKKKISIISSSGLSTLTGKFCTSTSFQWSWDTSVLAKGTAAAVVREGLKDWYFITADVAFGHSLAEESMSVVVDGGGKVLGESRHPYIASDHSSFLLQAQSSGAQVVALANSASDTTNSIKQAMEFGVTNSARVVALLAFITDVKSVGLEAAQGLILTESFYWDMNDETRAWSERFAAKMGGQMPSMAHAAVYSGVTHYLKAVEALGSKDAEKVADKMREMPINDFMIKDGVARKDGRIVHDFYLFEVKSPSESTGPWDLYKLIRTIPAAEVTPPEGSTGCPL